MKEACVQYAAAATKTLSYRRQQTQRPSSYKCRRGLGHLPRSNSPSAAAGGRQVHLSYIYMCGGGGGGGGGQLKLNDELKSEFNVRQSLLRQFSRLGTEERTRARDVALRAVSEPTTEVADINRYSSHPLDPLSA